MADANHSVPLALQVRVLRLTVEGYDDRLERVARREERLSQVTVM